MLFVFSGRIVRVIFVSPSLQPAQEDPICGFAEIVIGAPSKKNAVNGKVCMGRLSMNMAPFPFVENVVAVCLFKLKKLYNSLVISTGRF